MGLPSGSDAGPPMAHDSSLHSVSTSCEVEATKSAVVMVGSQEVPEHVHLRDGGEKAAPKHTKRKEALSLAVGTSLKETTLAKVEIEIKSPDEGEEECESETPKAQDEKGSAAEEEEEEEHSCSRQKVEEQKVVTSQADRVERILPQAVDHKLISLVWTAHGDKSSDGEVAAPRAVYVGHEKLAKSRKGLQKFGISVIVNCTSSVPNKFEHEDGLRYIRVPMSDDNDEALLIRLPQALCFIQEAGFGQNVLIHCSKGISRSVSVCIAWLVSCQKYTLRNALGHVKKRRPLAQPNPGFVQQLMKFESARFKRTSLSKEDFIPCSVCLQVDYEKSGKFSCGHKCCLSCLQTISSQPDSKCAHCIYKDSAAHEQAFFEASKGSEGLFESPPSEDSTASLSRQRRSSSLSNFQPPMAPFTSTFETTL